MNPLPVREFRELLRYAFTVASDADTTEPDVGSLFTPTGHRLALSPDVSIVVGARGTGKTYWSTALTDPTLRDLAADAYEIGALRNTLVVTGYGNEQNPDSYPTSRTLAMLMQTSSPQHIWEAVLLANLDQAFRFDHKSWATRTAWVAAHPEGFDRALQKADAEAREQRRSVLVVFDGLDRLHQNRKDNDQLIGGVLRVALDLRLGFRALRAKVFLRPDMLASAPTDFTDSSKLFANRAELTWTTPNLYGLAFQQLGNARTEAAEHFRDRYPHWRTEVDGARRLPPADVVGDAERQQEIFTDIAGPYMGTNHRRGHTYTWLPNHLMDGAEQVSPRSFLTALREAAEYTAEARSSHDLPLHHEGIRRGVQKASETRVTEVTEDIKWIKIAMDPLEGTQVPVDEEDVLVRWKAADVLRRVTSPQSDDVDGVRTGPAANTDRELVEELISLGMATRRANGRLDLPDVYRIAFKIGRKGGVPRIK
jgi:hypothetical protein